MKNYFNLFFLILFFSCESFDTNTNLEVAAVPGPTPENIELNDHVKESLKLMYPKIGKYKILVKQKTAVTNFIMGGNIYEVKFDLDGNWLKSDVVIAYEFTLPQLVQELLKSDEYNGWILSEKKLIQSPEEITYKFTWKKGEELRVVWVDRNGKLLRQKRDTEQLVK